MNIIILGLASLLTDISTEMVYPLLPMFLTQTLGASPAILGFIEGIAESVASLLRVFSGYISDRLGRRKPLAIAGYAASTLGKVFLVVAEAWPTVLAGRFVDRFGKGVRTAPRDALIADSADPARRGRAYGLHRAMDSLGATLGVVVAIVLLRSGAANLRAIFLWSLIPAALGVGVLFFARDVRSHRVGTHAPVLRWSVLPAKLRAYMLVVFLFTLGNSSNQFLLLRAQNLGVATAAVLVLYLVFNITYAVVAYPAGRLSDWVGRRTLLVAGYALYGLVYLGFGLASSPGSLWLLFPVYGLYMGVFDGVEKALVADLAPTSIRATAIGFHATLVGIGLLPASLLAGWMWTSFGPAVPFYFGGVLGCAAALAVLIVLGKS
ncbi:MAG: MFS transporter [Armatimonadetes bacterium 13_1_40CM_64_14]|nr:MAG: MFS transporter [Armatimonadetes bacterium 13_1_40CM_64_14]